MATKNAPISFLQFFFFLSLVAATACTQQKQDSQHKADLAETIKKQDMVSSVGPTIREFQRKTAAVQRLIDSKELAPYLHPEMKERVPLVISDNLIGTVGSLSKFDKPVIIKDNEELKGAFLRFTKFHLNATECYIDLEYPIEGVRGRFKLVLSADNTWSIEKAKIWEI